MHHLAVMHQQLGNYFEAGICFKSHADRLGWSDKILRQEPTANLDEEPEWKRHVNLCESAMKAFLLGEAWEVSVRVCQELAKAYETQLFNLKALSAILEKQAQMWKFINGQDRVFHTCFLVCFRGNQFDDSVKNSNFIYRSGRRSKPESVRDFTERIKQKYPNAKIHNGAETIPKEYDNSNFDGGFIRITTLNPSSKDEMDGADFKWEKNQYVKAPLRLKKYYREMETDVYRYSEQKKVKREKGENEFRSLWVTDIFVIAEEQLPSKRRRIPVKSFKRIEYTPLQFGVLFLFFLWLLFFFVACFLFFVFCFF